MIGFGINVDKPWLPCVGLNQLAHAYPRCCRCSRPLDRALPGTPGRHFIVNHKATVRKARHPPPLAYRWAHARTPGVDLQGIPPPRRTLTGSATGSQQSNRHGYIEDHPALHFRVHVSLREIAKRLACPETRSD